MHRRPGRRPDRHAGDERTSPWCSTGRMTRCADAVHDGDPRRARAHELARARRPRRRASWSASAARRGAGAASRTRGCCCAATARCAATCGRSTRRCDVVAPARPACRCCWCPRLPGGRAHHDRRRPPAGARRRAGAARPRPSTPRDGAARLPRRAPGAVGGRALAAGGWPSADAVEVPLAQVRAAERRRGRRERGRPGGRAGGRPAVVVPDAETNADLRVIASGLRRGRGAGIAVDRALRPGVRRRSLTGTGATRASAAPPRRRSGVLVLCGSFVPATTAQLDELERRRPGVTASRRRARARRRGQRRRGRARCRRARGG